MTRLLITLSFAAALALTGCQSTAAGGGDAAAPVNTACPINTDHGVDAAKTTEFEGMTIGFCCGGCVDDFEALSREEKVAHLAAVGVQL